MPDIKIDRNCGRTEYLVRRLCTALLYTRLYRRLHPTHPFYAPAAVRRLASLIENETKVFEWGSGASTLWYAERVKEIVSVEHDESWHARGVEALRDRRFQAAQIVHCPTHEAREGSGLRKPRFEDYTRVIDQFPDRYFDFIAIDGRERVGCLKRALPKLSATGTILLDDSHRLHYREAFALLTEPEIDLDPLLPQWKIETFDFGLMQTTLFTRSAHPIDL